MIRLNLNIDHVATVRNARGGTEPNPITAALIAEIAGAQGIVCHLREDRRHVNDRDLRLLRDVVQTKLDMEMAAVDEIVDIALEIKPDLVTIVPEHRLELTTEGGLDVTRNFDKLKVLCDKMHDKGISVSFFVEPSRAQIDSSFKAGANMVEIHTGVYANTKNQKDALEELEGIRSAIEFAHNLGLEIAAGHGLNYYNVMQVAGLGFIDELSIGHSIISRALFVGIEQAVREMIDLINKSEKRKS